MKAAVKTCDPPVWYQHIQWHWLWHAAEQRWFVAEVRCGEIWSGPGHLNGAIAYERGWRYIAPADPPSTDHLGRDAKDFAIEFGEYLAAAASRFQDVIQDVMQAPDSDHDTINDASRALSYAVYEFRKRAERAK